MKVVLQKISFNLFFSCFFTKNKYRYLGYTCIPYSKGSEEYKVILDFLKFVDKNIRPTYIPRFVLRLLHLFGNDNSIVRVRNRFLHKLHNKILKGVFITDIKTKWYDYDIRIYGYFPDFIQDEIDKVEDKIYEIYKKRGEI